ncbi:hypothetical protein ACFU99_34640, partial [Streptomyces sp. NPDC057654]
METATFSSHATSGSRQTGSQFAGSLGGGGGPRWATPDAQWAVDTTGDGTRGKKVDNSSTAGTSVSTDQFNLTTEGGTELFRIPARFGLDLYEGTSPEPLVRFAQDPARPAPVTAQQPVQGLPAPVTAGQNMPTVPAPVLGGQTAPAAPAAPAAAPAAPITVPGTITLAVPHARTLPADTPAPAPREPDVIRAPRTGGGQDDDFERMRMTDAAGNPRPGQVRLPSDANVDDFRAAGAIQRAFQQLVDGTYPGHPATNAFGQWVNSATGRLPGVVTAVGSGVAEYLAGPSATDSGAFAAEALFQQIRTSSLIGRSHQIFNGTYVIEGLVLPGLAADQEMSLDIRGILHHPAHDGSFTTYGESDMSSTDTRSRSRNVTNSREYGGSVGALQSAPALPSRGLQAQPSGRGAQSRSVDDGNSRSTSTSVVRVPVETGRHHLITADATLLLTLRRGTRNVVGHLAGMGSRDDITIAIDLPRSVRFSIADSHLHDLARWFAGVRGIPAMPTPPNTLPLPEHFVQTRQLGYGSVRHVTQLDHAVRRNEVRDRLHDELLALLEREAPGVTRPGSAAYMSGLAAQIATMTAQDRLRALPGRGSVTAWYRYPTTGGTRLLQITLSAEPEAQSAALRQVRGRPAGEGAGLDQLGIHAPNVEGRSHGTSRTRKVGVNPITRYPRPNAAAGRTDRTGPTLSAARSTARSARIDNSADDRHWTRTENAADYSVAYTLTGSVRSQLIPNWPPDLLGGAAAAGWIALSEGSGESITQRLQRLLRGRPTRTVQVPASVALRFAGSETTPPRTEIAPPVRPWVTGADPRLSTAERGPLPMGRRPFTAGPALVPTGATPVFTYNAFHELAEAIRTVAPGAAEIWGLTPDLTPEAASVRLGELIQAGEISLPPAGTGGEQTSRVPGAWPADGESGTAPALQVSLHNPRPLTEAEDIAMDRLRVRSRSQGSSSSVGTTAGMGYQTVVSGNQANLHLVGFTVPVLQEQPVTRTGGGSNAAGGWDRIKTGGTSRSATETNTRSHETMVDVVLRVEGPGGTRYVTGTATVRLFERDLLGYGVIGPRSASRVYDLPAMLNEQPHTPLRNWLTHPVTQLPAALAAGLNDQEGSAQLWLDLGADPDSTALARALYVGSRTAQAARRPVELALRGNTGLRFWPFAADGSLVDTTHATAAAWNRIQGHITAATDAAAAEAAAVANEQWLLPDLEQAAAELAAADAGVATADTAHTAAADALTEARQRRQAVNERLTEARRAQADAEGAARAQAQAQRAAQVRVASAERAVAEAEAALEAAEAADDSASDTSSVAGSEPDLEADLTAARNELGAAEGALTGARARAEVAQEAADRAAANADSVDRLLTVADRRAEDAARAERTAGRGLAQATSRRDEDFGFHQRLLEQVRQARQEQADQRGIWEEAWAQMPGLAGNLSADRCREGTGGARFP